MMDLERFRPYWIRTRWLAVFLCLIWFLVTIAAVCFTGLLNDIRLFGFPVGLFILGPMTGVFATVLMFWFVGAQDQIDQNFGANEDL